jgi:cytidine deaminase
MSVKKIKLIGELSIYEAKKAADSAYAPYSGFNVGAAVLLENGKIVTGNNQENAAYPSGLCAERVALFYASSQFPNQKIIALAVTAKSASHPISSPVTPCGSCRQVIAEYEAKFDSPIKTIMSGETGEIFVCESVSILLPLVFNRQSLPATN